MPDVGFQQFQLVDCHSQVLEVERLELDHFWEIHRQQLEQSDQDGTSEAATSEVALDQG